MNDFNIATKSKEEQDKVNVDLAASGVAYKERLNTCASISWNASATTASKASSPSGPAIRAIWK